jgi:uncharacterized protein (DUF1778 family)
MKFARRGAPPVKSACLTLRVTPEEKAELHKAAKRRGKTLSDWLLGRALEAARIGQ